MLGHFTSEVSLTPLRGNRERWRVNKGFQWHIGYRNSDFHVLVPAGFVYDLASVPMLARPIVPHTTAPQASALHDYGYRHNCVWVIKRWDNDIPVYHGTPIGMDRAFWDQQFYEGMIALDVFDHRALAAYAGVRAGGWMSWNKHVRAGTHV